MGMAVGGKGGGLNNEPNVVPMIDVLLVLLIIFMVMQPMSRKAIDLQLPDPTPSVAPANAVSNQIVLEVLPGDQYAINKEPVSKDGLLARLKSIYDPRPDKIMFVKGDPKVKYQAVIFAMDQARGAGVKVIGVTPKDADTATPK
ncbi:MAG: biopolymer transporter ExbD [Gemmatimonadota bacterium]